MSRRRSGAIENLWVLAGLSLLILAVLIGMLFWSPFDRQANSTGVALFTYCAAGMRVPVDLIAEEYARESFGQAIQLQYGGSNTLLSQLEAAGVGDLYIAGDNSYIETAIGKGLVKESLSVAWIRPVVVVRRGNPKDIWKVDDLLRGDVRVALGNPDATAVGKKTRRLMRDAGHWESLSEHSVVLMPTVNEIANAVTIGSVDAGIAWDAVVVQNPELEAVRIPELDTGAARIVIGVLSSSKQPTDALRFARYLAAEDKGLRAFKQQGFQPVDGDRWEVRPRLTVFSGGVNRLAIEPILKQFEQREGVQIDIVYNGCGTLCAQMKAIRQGDRPGALPDAYFACDVSFMEQVSDLFLDPVHVSETDIVIIVQRDNPRGIRSLNDLARSDIRLGVANPEESALGALTRKLVRELGIEDEIQSTVSMTTPTADLLVNSVKIGGLEAAVVYRANTLHVTDELEVIDVDHRLARAVQPYAEARDTNHRQTIHRLMKAVGRSGSQFEAAGFRYLLDARSP